LRILITGVAGFAGRHLVRDLAEQGGHDLHGADHAPLGGPGHETADQELTRALASFQPLDVTNSGAFATWIRERKPEAVVHLAAQASGADSLERPAETYRVNAIGALNLLESTRVAAPKAVLLVVGSADIYGSGDSGMKIREDAPIRPRNPYALSKAAQDALAEIYAATYGLPAVRTRTFSHTGPGQGPRFALASFADQLARIDAGETGPELRVGNLSAVREYGDVRDVVRAYRLLLGRGVAGEPYNVATGRGYVLRDLLDRLLSISGVRAQVTTDPARVRARDVDHLVGDPSKLEAATGWTASYGVDQTLEDLYRDARERVRRETGR
jgi:GDP-4-dehydro-6-deoxy-D-mannose reductase